MHHLFLRLSLGESRYDVIERLVALAIESTQRELLPYLLWQLARCPDEGVRWAVSKRLPLWFKMVSDPQVKEALFWALLEDQHPWVLRETAAACCQIADILENDRRPSILIK